MICLIISISCQSQTTTEKLIPVRESTLRKIVAQLEVGKFNAEKASLLSQQVEILKEQIAVKDSMLNTYKVKDNADAAVLDTYKKEIENLNEQLAIAKKEMLHQNKLFRRQKRKTVFLTIAGPVVTAAAILYLKK